MSDPAAEEALTTLCKTRNEENLHCAPEQVDVAVIGAGAAGLMCAIQAARILRTASAGSIDADKNSPPRIVALDGARTLGAKILVAGGGRCNVTHDVVDESAYAGSSRNAVRKVLRAFGVEETVEFFRRLGVELKREETGKLFPADDSARTVLDALLRAARESGVELRHPWRVESVEPRTDGLLICPGKPDPSARPILARAAVLATGGRSLPKTGSDGHGYAIAQALGHTTTERTFPALVPLVIDVNKTFLTALSGVTAESELAVLSSTGKKLASFTGPLLLTHFGLSGPAALDISRYFTQARADDPGARLVIHFAPGRTFEEVERWFLASPGSADVRVSVMRRLQEDAGLAERLARALCEQAGIEPGTNARTLSKDARRTLVHLVTACDAHVVGDRGFTHAEVTAGGLPLGQLRLETMQSRLEPRLFVCGEVCDVDGRIGGYNFQWAWSSGTVAGRGVASFLRGSPGPRSPDG